MLNLNEINLAALKRIGKEIKIKGFSTMKKEDLVGAISTAIEEDNELFATAETLVEQIAAETPVKVKTSAAPSLGIKELTFNGKTQSITKWAEEVGLQRAALYDRINRHGWSIEEALTIPKGGHRKSVKTECEGQLAIEE